MKPRFKKGDEVFWIDGTLYRKDTGFDYVIAGKGKINIVLTGKDFGLHDNKTRTLYILEDGQPVFERFCFKTKGKAEYSCKRRNERRRNEQRKTKDV